jgi:hypothetical protein
MILENPNQLKKYKKHLKSLKIYQFQ